MEARRSTARTSRRSFELAGYPAARAKAAADTVFRMEKQLAAASLDNVARRDPKATDHKMSFAELQRASARFDWAAYARREGVPPGAVNVTEPAFLKEVNRQLSATPLAGLEDVPLLARARLRGRRPCPRRSWPRTSPSTAPTSRARRSSSPAGSAASESTDELLGEALGQKYVEKYFPPEAKARMQEMVKNLRTAMGETIEGLDWMSAETKKRALEKLATFNPKVGYPDRWKDYSAVPISRVRTGTTCRRPPLQRRGRLRHASASPSIAAAGG